MDVPFDGGEHDDPLLRTCRVGEGGSHDVEALLCRLGGSDELREEYPARGVVVADAVQRGDERAVDHREPVPVFQEDAGDVRGTVKPLGDAMIQLLLRACGRFRLRGRALSRRAGSGLGFDVSRIFLCILRASRVSSREHVECVHRLHILRDVGVEDGKVQPRIHRHGEECGVDDLPCRQSERDVGHPESGLDCVSALYLPDGGEGEHSLILLRADCEGETVHNHILLRDADGFCGGDDLFRERDPLLHGVRHSPLVHGESDDRRAVLFRDGEQFRKGLLLRIDGVEDGFARVGAQRPLHRLGLAAVDLKGRVRQSADKLQ